MLRWRDRGNERLDWRDRHGDGTELLNTDLNLQLIAFSMTLFLVSAAATGLYLQSLNALQTVLMHAPNVSNFYFIKKKKKSWHFHLSGGDILLYSISPH